MRRWTGRWPAKNGIEDALAARHLADGTLVLYDVSSAAFEGRHLPAGGDRAPQRRGPGRLQIVYGLLCTTAGVPVAIEVFEGNTGDPKTLAAQITQAQEPVRADPRGPGRRPGHAHQRPDRARSCARPRWTGSPRCAPRRSRRWSATARCSCRCSTSRTWPRSPTRTTPASGWSRCHNPFLAAERARKRDELLAATEADLDKIAAATRRATPAAARQGQDRAAGRQGAQPPQGRQALHHRHHRRRVHLPPQRATPSPPRPPSTASTCCAPACPPTPSTATMWCSATRHSQTSSGSSAPSTPTWTSAPSATALADRVRAHVFLRMLSYYISWHMQQALAPILFNDDDKPAAAAKRADPVAPAHRSDPALAKAARKRTAGGPPVHSFTSLLADLATICPNHIQPADALPAFTMITTPTPLQRQAFDLLGVTHRLGYA